MTTPSLLHTRRYPCNICHIVLYVEALFLHAMLTADSCPLGSLYMCRRPQRDILKLAGQEGKPLLLRKEGVGTCCSLPAGPCL